MLLQLALDFVGLDDALAMAERVAVFADRLEAGTPLIKTCGLAAVRALKARFPHKTIVADMKTADTGALEAELAFEAGADITTVLAAAPRETIVAAVRAAKACGRAVMMDTIGMDEPATAVDRIGDLAIEHLIVHTGIDEQRSGRSLLSKIAALERLGTRVRLAVAGGLDARGIAGLARYPAVEVVIVGGAIARASEPAVAARMIRELLDRRG